MDPLELVSEAYLRSQDRKSEFLSDPDIEKRFQGVRAQIDDLLANTEYFHGTGQWHYKLQGDSKYEGVDPYEAVDNLPSFMERGLHPRQDLFAENFVGFDVPSISLSERRMYSRVYADCFMPEGQKLDYEYGPRAFWWEYFLTKMLLDAAKDPSESSIYIQRRKAYWNQWIQKFFIPEDQLKNFPFIRKFWNFLVYTFYIKDEAVKKLMERGSHGVKTERNLVNYWSGTFRNDHVYDKKPFKLMIHGQSTIERNVPLIIGVKPALVDPLPIKRRPVRRYEARSAHPIPPEHWSYVEAPLKNVEAVRKQIQALGYAIPVMPMEFVELVMSEKPLRLLTTPHKGWDKQPPMLST